MKTYRLLTDAAWHEGQDGLQDLINPSTGEPAARIWRAGSADIERALAAAVRAREAWAQTPAAQRAQVLGRAAQQLQHRREETAQHMVCEQGKTLDEARGELQRAIETFQWCAQAGPGLCAPSALDGRRTRLYRPLGVVAAFTPWNYPAVLGARKLAPALAAGCPVILKAAEEAPAAAEAIAESLLEAGLPGGCLALLFGHPPALSQQLLASPEVRVLTFTGSTRVGKALAALASDHLQRCILELGGHAPVLVFEDADLPAAACAISRYKFEYAGQSCNAPSRLLVQRSVYEPFLRLLATEMAALRVGDARHPETQMGPMIGPQGPARMQRLIEDALARGARRVCGDSAPAGPGFFWLPTLLADVPPQAQMMHEEPFGPLLAAQPFDSLEEALAAAHHSRYGLAAYLFGGSPAQRQRCMQTLAVGTLSLDLLQGVAPDAPLNGIKESGYGCEGGEEGFRAFQYITLVNSARASPGP